MALDSVSLADLGKVLGSRSSKGQHQRFIGSDEASRCVRRTRSPRSKTANWKSPTPTTTRKSSMSGSQNWAGRCGRHQKVGAPPKPNCGHQQACACEDALNATRAASKKANCPRWRQAPCWQLAAGLDGLIARPERRISAPVAQIVQRALSAPLRQIADNAGRQRRGCGG